MRFVKPTVRLIAKTEIQPNNIKDWLSDIGCRDDVANEYAAADDKTDAEALVELAGRRCYMSFEPGLNPNVTKIRADIAQYIDNILASGHGSVLEHAWFTFAIENVSRVFTGEMNRHRAGTAISEGSMRYIRFTDIPVVETPMLAPDWENTEDDRLNEKVHATRFVFERVVAAMEKGYSDLLELWKDELAPDSKFHMKKQVTSMIRRIVPMGVATGGVWSMNARALRHVCELRTSEAAEEEVALVAGKILEIMTREEPTLFGDFERLPNNVWKPKYKKV